MNIEQARFNMVEQQIRPWEVLDPDVLGMLFEVKREQFVPAAYREIAFADLEVPLGHGETMWAPKIEARVLQEVAPRSGEAVYEVGTGSGHLAALLAHRSAHVTSVEIHPDLAATARGNLRAAGIANVELLVGDGARAPLDARPFDVIVLTGSTPFVPEAFFAQLNIGGRLFAVTGDAPVMKATVFHKGSRGDLRAEELFETCLKPLVNAQQPSRFRF